MKALLMLLLSLISSICYGQQDPSEEPEMFSMDINKNIFRLTLTAIIPRRYSWPLAFSYEREIKRPLTLVLKAGPTFDYHTYTAEGSLNSFVSGELRYYLTLFKRIRKERSVRNFTGCYLSFEEYVLSDPLIVVNQSRSSAIQGACTTFLNVGFQKQSKQTYISVFFGPYITFSNYNNGLVTFDTPHWGITYGHVLFE
jgi:hypothetical protein